MFNELVDERREKITDLDKKVNSDDLIYRYKYIIYLIYIYQICNISDVKFDKFDNNFDVIDKIRDGKIDLADVKTNQKKFRSYLGEIKKGNKKHRSKEQKTLCTILKCFTKRETKLLNFMMIILQ